MNIFAAAAVVVIVCQLPAAKTRSGPMIGASGHNKLVDRSASAASVAVILARLMTFHDALGLE